MTISNEIGDKYEHLMAVLKPYDDIIADEDTIGEQLRMKGKSLDEACRENPGWQLYYDQRRVELDILVTFFEGEIKRIAGKLYKRCKENQGRNIELNEREILKWIEEEPALQLPRACLLEVKELAEKFKAIVAAFQTRGYSLNNITKARVAEVNNLPI